MPPADKNVLILLVRLLLGTIIATFVLYYWSPIYKELLPSNIVSPLYDEEPVVRFLQESFPESGTYTVPSVDDAKDDADALLKIGPVATLHILSSRDAHLKAGTRKIQLAQIALTTFLIGWILRMTRPALVTYRARLTFLTLLGITAAAYNDLADPAWTFYTWRWMLAKAVFHLTSWIIAGLIMDFFIRYRDDPGI